MLRKSRSVSRLEERGDSFRVRREVEMDVGSGQPALSVDRFALSAIGSRCMGQRC
jgi:hypothetical protein